MRPIVLCALLLAPLPAAGQTVAGQMGAGNLPPDFYPRPTCEKPVGPSRPPELQNQTALQAYNARVKKFDSQAVAFNACMKDYKDRAQHDIEVIQAVVHAAVAAANAPQP